MKHNFEKVFDNYTSKDISNFAPSPAIYFMDGFSAAHIRILGSNEEIVLEFRDLNTSIAASSPELFAPGNERKELYVPVPEPLRPFAIFPFQTPYFYKRETTHHLLQVVSMNMKGSDSNSNLLIGLPYATKYPHIFYDKELFKNEENIDGSSFGVVSSLTDFTNSETGLTELESNGYPARSFFGIYHIIETPIGALFNKKATQMELQPDKNGKLALTLPPIPFMYELINGPIPLFHVDNPKGEPVAELFSARHGSDKNSGMPTANAWPWFKPDLPTIETNLKAKLGNSFNPWKIGRDEII